jgi:hypothetical protein
VKKEQEGEEKLIIFATSLKKRHAEGRYRNKIARGSERGESFKAYI